MPLKSAYPVLNLVAPGHDRAALVWHANSLTPVNLARGNTSLGSLTLSGGALTTDSEGTHVDLASGGYLQSVAVGSETLIPNFYIRIRVKNIGSSAASRPIWTTNTNPTTSHGSVLIQRPVGTNKIRVQIRDNTISGARSYDFDDVDFSADNDIEAWGGATAFHARLNGESPDSSSNAPETYFGPLRIQSGERITIGRNMTSGNTAECIVKQAKLLLGTLDSIDRSKYLVDPFLLTREPPGMASELAATSAWSSGNVAAGTIVKASAGGDVYFESESGGTTGGSEPTWNTYANETTTDGFTSWKARTPALFGIWSAVPIGRPTKTTAMGRLAISKWLKTSGTIYVRAKVATTTAGLAGATPVVFSGTATAMDKLDMTLTGLSADTRYYVLWEWSLDGTNYYPFPGGYQDLPTQHATSVSFKAIWLGDSHCTLPSTNVLPDNLGSINNLAYTAAGAVNETHGLRTRMAFQKTMQAVKSLRGTFEWVGFGGDHENSDIDTASSSSENSSTVWQAFRSWGVAATEAICAGPIFWLTSNHGCDRGDFQNRLGGLQRRAQNARLKHVPNPIHTTYPQGGEYQTQAWWRSFTSVAANHDNLENYFAVDWTPDWRLIFLDSETYSIVGREYSQYADQPSQFRLGPQKDWVEPLLLDTSVPGKVTFRHSRFGGENCGAGQGTGYYGRGNHFAMVSPDYTLDEAWLAEKLERGSATLDVNNHDHKFTLSKWNNVTYYYAGQCGTNSHFTATTNRCWHFTEIQAFHGTAESLGAVNGAGTSLLGRGMQWHYNTCGFTLLEFSSTGVWITVYQTAVQTSASGDVESDNTKFMLQWNGTASQSWGERWLAPATETPDANDRVDIADSLNATPIPRTIYGVYDDPAGTWWTGSLTNHAARAVATTIVANSTVTYTVGDIVRPTIPNGWLYRCTARTGACSAEPTHNGVAGTQYPTTLAGTITVGNTTWEACQRDNNGIEWDGEFASSTIQCSSAVGASVRVVYTPRIIKREFVSMRTYQRLQPESIGGASMTPGVNFG